MGSAILMCMLSLALVSSLGLVGALTFSWDEAFLGRAIPKLIAIAAGVLIGEAVFHLIPESLNSGTPGESVALGVVLGAIVSFLVEFLSRQGPNTGAIKPVARLSLISESVHNAIDGAIIAGAFLVGPRVGLLATVAIMLHEIPHELGNFAILIHAGYDRLRALRLNLLSASSAFLGGALVFVFRDAVQNRVGSILPFAAGCFLYMALVDLVPNLWHSHRTIGRATIGYGLTAGMTFMLLLAGRG